MKKKIQFCVVILFTLFCVSCAISTGINKLGPDTYTLSSRNSLARGGMYGAESDVLSQANQFCQSMGKEILVQSTAPAYHSFSAIFQCLNRKDASLRRPHFEPAPSMVVKNVIQ